MRSLGLLTCIATAACSFSSPSAPPDGASGDDAATPPDQNQIPPDARLCFGDGLGKLCLSKAPAQARTLSGTIDTGTEANCDEVIDVGGTSSCVITGTTVNITSAGYRGTGSRPLVIVASDVLTIEGDLDVGSKRGGTSGAGASTALCPGVGSAKSDDGGGGGGAGGSFLGAGGDGGVGDTNTNGLPVGTAAGGTHAAAATPTQLRAGCRGGSGGGGGGGSTVGSGGRGGGAIYLIAGAEIRISGRVAAYGAGGGGGVAQGGGGGGGSGGMIGLDAPSVQVSGSVTANGGGGGEGAGTGSGDYGDDGTTDDTRAAGGKAAAGDGGNSDGGNGGLGSGGAELAGGGGIDDTGAGGGGGGGAGFIYVKGVLALTGAASPAPSQN